MPLGHLADSHAHLDEQNLSLPLPGRYCVDDPCEVAPGHPSDLRPVFSSCLPADPVGVTRPPESNDSVPGRWSVSTAP